MAIIIEYLNSPTPGAQYIVFPGFIIGSSLGNNSQGILINGRNISSVHAKVLEDDRGQLVLTCTNITSEIIVNARGVKRVFLKHGVYFKIDNHRFKVIENKNISAPTPENLLAKPQSENSTEKSLDSISKKVDEAENSAEIEIIKSPTEILLEKYAQFIDFDHLLIHERARKDRLVRPLKTPLMLKFLQGLQVDTEIHLGWGPRIFGSSSNEFQLIDPQAPHESFILFPAQNGDLFFITKHPEIVKLNNESHSKQILNFNDKISFGDTIIRISESNLEAE